MVPKKKQWREGRQLSQWPMEEHIGWVVVTAGWVDLSLEDSGSEFNYRLANYKLPPGYRMILKDIVDGDAYTYHDGQGVMRMPVELLEPWTR